LLIASKLIQVFERESGISKSIPLLDDLRIEKGSIFKEDIGECPFVPVFVADLAVCLVKL